MKPKKVIIGCIPVESDIADITPSEGSIKGRCEACRGEVWLGLKQQEAIEKTPEATLMCYICIVEAGVTPQWLMAKKQAGELEDLGGPTATLRTKHSNN